MRPILAVLFSRGNWRSCLIECCVGLSPEISLPVFPFPSRGDESLGRNKVVPIRFNLRILETGSGFCDIPQTVSDCIFSIENVARKLTICRSVFFV